MRKVAKRRHCPAVGHEITSAECGDNRGGRYACPADCLHSLQAPANYEHFLDLEETVDGKLMARIFEEAPEFAAFAPEMQQARKSKSLHAMHAQYSWQLFFKRDAAGLTCAERWERTGFPGLKNDERTVVRAKMRTRIALLEVRCVRDAERTEAIDLLAPGSAPMVIHDRGLASMAVRFSVFLAWAFPLPHYWRMSGTAIVLSEMSRLDAVEVVTELVRHLGGPVTEPELRLWLAENFLRFHEAIEATGNARHQRMLAGIDAHFGKAVYEFRAPPQDCRATLDATPDVEADNLSPEERREGFTEARVWFANDTEAGPVFLAVGQSVLGRVLLGAAQCRVEAMGAARTATLRERFEARLGSRVRFVSESRDDLGHQTAMRRPAFDASLVPPRLLEDTQQIALVSSRVPGPIPQQARPQTEADFMALQDRAFLDDHIPALDGRTPREAARDPALRPKLIRLLKHRVRTHDERNLRHGRTDDINWMLRELGADEIIFDPPPRRAPIDGHQNEMDVELGEDETDLPDAPPLPDEPWSFEEAAGRLEAAMSPFDTAADAMAEMEATGSTLIADVDEFMGNILNDTEFSMLIPFLIQTWFAFVPVGCQGPHLAKEDLAQAFGREVENLARSAGAPTAAGIKRFLESGAQPALNQMLAAELFKAAIETPKKLQPRPQAVPAMLTALKAVVEELDRAMRSARPE